MLLKKFKEMSVYHEDIIYVKRSPIYRIENWIIMCIINEMIMHFNCKWRKAFCFGKSNIGEDITNSKVYDKVPVQYFKLHLKGVWLSKERMPSRLLPFAGIFEEIKAVDYPDRFTKT